MNNIRRTTGDFGKKIGNPNPLEYDAVLALKANLLQATHHMRQYCPAVKVFNPARFCRNSPPAPPLVEHGDVKIMHVITCFPLPLNGLSCYYINSN